jgi:hypothetical protein
LLRYFVVATILVLGLAIVLAGGWHETRAPLKLAPGKGKVAPARGYGNDAPDSARDRPFIADVSWALSALPECLLQRDEQSGQTGQILADVPKNAQPVPAPSTLHYGDCTILVRPDDAMVLRGRDRLHIPASVRFYRLGRKLILLHADSSGAQLRTYVPSNP